MLQAQVAALDVGLFAHIDSETSPDDRRSHLAIHNAIATRADAFSYLEIGSHLGGTLQALIADPRCVRIVSIDPRPASQPDDRPGQPRFAYEDNSTQRMLDHLSRVPEAELSKLETVEDSTENIAPGRFARPDVCFIDGEHTRRAALRDARFCRTVMGDAGIIAFHDYWVIQAAVLDFLREAPRPRRAYLLRDSIFVVELGVESLIGDANIQRQMAPKSRILARSGWADTLLMAAHVRRSRAT